LVQGCARDDGLRGSDGRALEINTTPRLGRTAGRRRRSRC